MTTTEHDEHDEFADIRDAVAKLCAQFPGEYWRKLDREMAYPSAFVDALTGAGALSGVIPEEYGGGSLSLGIDAGRIWRRRAKPVRGRRDPRRDPARRMQWRRLPRPDVHHGYAAAARQRRAESQMAAPDRQRRIAVGGGRG